MAEHVPDTGMSAVMVQLVQRLRAAEAGDRTASSNFPETISYLIIFKKGEKSETTISGRHDDCIIRISRVPGRKICVQRWCRACRYDSWRSDGQSFESVDNDSLGVRDILPLTCCWRLTWAGVFSTLDEVVAGDPGLVATLLGFVRYEYNPAVQGEALRLAHALSARLPDLLPLLAAGGAPLARLLAAPPEALGAVCSTLPIRSPES